MGVEAWDWSLRLFDHVDLHANNYRESVRFYETVLASLGVPKLLERHGWTCFANLNVADRRPATQHLHLCFHARTKDQVDEFHRAGTEGGFRSNGAPGYRDYGPGYYAAYLLDPDATTWRRSTGIKEMSATEPARGSAESHG